MLSDFLRSCTFECIRVNLLESAAFLYNEINCINYGK